jgi:hypothetical protein
LLQAGVHPKIASERAGHSSIALTMDLYSHVVEAMQQDGCGAAYRRRAPEGPGWLGWQIDGKSPICEGCRSAKPLISQYGWVAEWLKAPVLKTANSARNLLAKGSTETAGYLEISPSR